MIPSHEWLGYSLSSLSGLAHDRVSRRKVLPLSAVFLYALIMHSYVSCHLHCVFATAERRPFLRAEVRQRLWPYIGGIARENKMTALSVDGIEDHVHVLLSLPATISISKTMQLIKGNSSKWIHETFADLPDFAWQEGYGAFSIGVSGIEGTRSYIARQTEHHRKRSFREEMEEFLVKHGMTWTERDAVDRVFRAFHVPD